MAIPFKCDELVTIESPPAIDPATGELGATWTIVAANYWANAQDVLPSRSESVEHGLRIGVLRTRLRMRVDDAITATMRVTLHNKGDRVMQIIAGPSLLDDREHMEFMLEAYSNG
jgi:head-tail adaptor